MNVEDGRRRKEEVAEENEEDEHLPADLEENLSR